MRMYQVEVDEEVFQFVKAHAEPLVDTFNSALRRQLPLGKAKHPREENNRHGHVPLLPAFSKYIPQALRQILEVVHLVLNGSDGRTAATHYVARLHNVEAQTIYDKYTRQLNLTTVEFDRLLEEAGQEKLSKILKSKFPGFTQLIDQVLGESRNKERS
jgi:negative regulator of replication initiation